MEGYIMKHADDVLRIVRGINNSPFPDIITAYVPTLRDVAETRLLLSLGSDVDEKKLRELSRKFPSLTNWIETIQRNPDWQYILSDCLALEKITSKQ